MRVRARFGSQPPLLAQIRVRGFGDSRQSCLPYSSERAAPPTTPPPEVAEPQPRLEAVAPAIRVSKAPPPSGGAPCPPKGVMIPEAPFWVDYGSEVLGEDDRRRAGPFRTSGAAISFAMTDASIASPGRDGWYRVLDCLGRTTELACSECATGHGP